MNAIHTIIKIKRTGWFAGSSGDTTLNSNQNILRISRRCLRYVGDKLDTYLFGAGASKRYGLPPTNQKMPLANEFFTIFNHLKIWGMKGTPLTFKLDDKGCC